MSSYVENIITSKNELNIIIKKVKMFSGFKLLCFIMLFFPSITFGIIKAEIFPWAIIAAFFYFKKYSKDFIVVVFFFLVCSAISFIFHGPTDIIRSLASYMNTLCAFAFMLTISEVEVVKFIRLIKLIFIFLLTLGLLQYFNLVDFADGFIKLIIPRGSSIASFESNRGVRLLSSEPARAGNELIFLYFLFRYVFIKAKHRLVSDILFTLYLLIVIQSFMACAFFALFLVFNIKLKSALISVFCLFLLAYAGLNFTGGRSVELVSNLFQLDSMEDIVFFLVNSSGNRLITIYSSYIYGVLLPFGAGLGNWLSGSIEAIKTSGIDVSEFSYYQVLGNGSIIGTRSSGFLSNLILETGAFGFLFVLRYLLKVLKKYWSISKDAKIVILSFLCKIFFIGSVGHPVAWVVTIIILRYFYLQKNGLSLSNINYSYNGC